MKNSRREASEVDLFTQLQNSLAKGEMPNVATSHTVHFYSRGKHNEAVRLTTRFSQQTDEKYRRQLEEDTAKWETALSAEMRTEQWLSLEKQFPGLNIIVFFATELRKMSLVWKRIQEVGKHAQTHSDAVTRQELQGSYVQFINGLVGSLWKQVDDSGSTQRQRSSKFEGSVGGKFSQLIKNLHQNKQITPDQYKTITRIFTLGLASTSADEWKELLTNGSLIDIDTLTKKDFAQFPVIREISQEILQIASFLHAFYVNLAWSCIDISHTDHETTVVWLTQLAHLLGTENMTTEQVVASLYDSVSDVLLAAQVLVPFEELDVISATVHHSQHVLDTIRAERELDPDEHLEQALADACRAFYESVAQTRVCVSQEMIDRFFSDVDESAPIDSSQLFFQTAYIFQQAKTQELSVSVPIYTDTEEDSTPILIQLTLNVLEEPYFSFSVNFLRDTNEEDVPRFFLHLNGKYSQDDIQLENLSSWAKPEKVHRQILTFLTSFLSIKHVQDVLIDSSKTISPEPAPQRQPDTRPAPQPLPSRPFGRKRTTASQAAVPTPEAADTKKEVLPWIPQAIFVPERIKNLVNGGKGFTSRWKREFWAFKDLFAKRNTPEFEALVKNKITPMAEKINITPNQGKPTNIPIYRIRPTSSAEFRILYGLVEATAVIFWVESREAEFRSYRAGELDNRLISAVEEYQKAPASK